MLRRNPSAFDIWGQNRHPFLDGANKYNENDSTYNETYGEESKTYDSDDDFPPSANASPVDSGVTVTDL